MSTLYTDNTSLSTFCKCPRMYYFRHVRHLVPNFGEGEMSPALNFGRAIHSGLEAYYKNGEDPTLAAKSFELEFNPSIVSDKHTLTHGLSILKDYHAKWYPERWEVVSVEASTSFELAKDLVFCAKLDTIVKMFGSHYIVEHKTSGSAGWFSPRPNHQLSGYCYAGRALGIDIQGAVANILYVLSPATKKKLEDRFHRLITARTNEELEEWKRWVLYTKHQIDTCLENGWFPLSTSECWRCSYRNLCNTYSNSSLEAIIEQDFKESKWAPWENND